VRSLRSRFPSVVKRVGGGSRRRRVAAAVGAIVVVLAAIALILSSSLTGSTRAAGRASKAQGATTVQRRDLIATDTESGTLSYANPQTVFNRMSGTITWLPAIGQVIKPGQTLYKVDGAPVVLFNGTVPAYRDLSESGTAGPDIEQLKKNLVALGFDPEHEITINQTFDAATAAAVERWQASVGATQTGSIALGQIVFLPGAQRITAVDASLGSNGGSSAGTAAAASSGAGSSGSGNPTTASTIQSPRPEFVSLTTAGGSKPDASKTDAAKSGARACPGPGSGAGHGGSGNAGGGQGASGKGKSSGSNPTLAALLALLKAETQELAHSRSGGASGAGSSGGSRAGGTSPAAAGRSRGAGGGAKSGSGAAGGTGGSGGSSGSGATGGSGSGAGGSAQPILQTTSTQLVVTVDLDATMQSEAVVHEPVSVELPDGSTVPGKLTAVSPVAQSSSSSSSASSSAGGGSGAGGGGGSNAPSATVPVTITLTGHRHVTGLDQAAVSVNFEQHKATNVLSVPVSALLATAGGGYAIQEAAAPQKLIPVTPGLFAAGYVQISGAGVFPGLQVTDSQG
jgi:Putative peptidoglycan binding domain